MRLAYPFALFLLLLIPIFHFWWSRRNKPARVYFSLPIPKAVKASHPFRAFFLLKYLAFALAVLALARPQSSYKQTERQTSGIDIMMVLDISLSMNIEDLAEGRSRIFFAKKTMEEFIKGRNSDRIGFVIFSGEPLTLSPPTLDYGLVLKALKPVEPGDLPDGTAIGDGLSLAINRLKASKAKSRVIVLLTDGDNNLGVVDPATAGDLAAGYGIKVYTIAIGKEGRVKLPIKRKGMLGNDVVTYQWFDNALNPELLQVIAKETDGRFYRVEDANTLEKVFSEIDHLEKTDLKSPEKIRFEENFAWPLLLAGVLMLLEKLLTRFGWRVLP